MPATPAPGPRPPGTGSALTTTIRAAISLLLLLGFYVLAAVLALGVAAVTAVLAVKAHGPAIAKILVFGGGVSVAILIAVAKSLKTRPFTPSGTQATRHDAYDLWSLVDDTARRVGTRAPDEIYLVPEVNAAVTEHTRFLGLVGGRRYLLVGLPLLAAMSVDQLRAVIAHELGHYSRSHTRLLAVTRRGHVAMGEMMEQFAHRTFNPVTWIFRGYGALYLLVEGALSRRQEFEADRVAARIAGRDTMRAALRETLVVARMWSFYFDAYVAMGLDHGIAPRGVLNGFSSLLEGRAERRERLRRAPLPEKTSLRDTHPPLAARVAALESAPERGEALSDPRPATVLLADYTAVADGMEAAFFRFGGRRMLDWPEYVAEAHLIERRRTAEAAYRAIGRVFGPRAELSALLEALDQGPGQDLFERLVRANFPEGGFDAMFEVCAYDSGVLRFELRWDAALARVRPNGEPFDTQPFLDALELMSAEGAERIRELFAEYGMEPAKAGLESPGTSAPVSVRFIAAVANVGLNDAPNDVFATDQALLFVPCQKSTDDGDVRLKRTLAGGVTPQAMASWPNVAVVPHEEVAGATIRKSVPIRAVIHMLNGYDLEITETWTGDALGNSAKVFRDIVEEYATREGRG